MYFNILIPVLIYQYTHLTQTAIQRVFYTQYINFESWPYYINAILSVFSSKLLLFQ